LEREAEDGVTPTLLGRIETRVFTLWTVGALWTLIVSMLLPGIPANASAATIYSATYRVLLVITILGVGWEFIYHFLQQFRWEKDWPIMYAFLTGINEGIVAWFVIRAIDIKGVSGSTFVVDFATTWIVVWLWVVGPMRVVFHRWRFRGGRLL